MVAELADHESWDQLAGAVALMGERGLEAKIRDAERVEAEHLVKVRGWMVAATKLVTKPGD